MKHIADLPSLPPAANSDAAMSETSIEDELSLRLDDRLVAYVLQAHRAFNLLRQSAMLLSGLMVLAATGIRGVRDHPMLAQARGVGLDAEKALADIQVPRRAAHHHRHLKRASGELTSALATAAQSLSWTEDRLEAIVARLRACERELKWGAGALPGFHMVALSEACCACRTGAAPALLRPSAKEVRE